MTDVAIESVVDLSDRFWQWFLSRSPIYATILGDERYDDRLPDVTRRRPCGGASSAARVSSTTPKRSSVPDLDIEDQITLDMLETVARIWIRQIDHNMHHFDAIDQAAGPQNLPGRPVTLPARGHAGTCRSADPRASSNSPITSPRIAPTCSRALPRSRTAAAPVVARVIEQTRRAVEGGADQSPLLVAHPELDEPPASAFARQSTSTWFPPWPITSSRSRATRSSRANTRALWALPDGERVYRTMIVASTTLDESPEALHQYGLEQIELIREETKAIARELGFDDVAAMRAALPPSPANFAIDLAGDRRPRERPDRQGQRRSAALVRPPAQGARARFAPSSRTRKRGAAGLLLTRPPRTARAAASTSSTPISPRSRPLYRLATTTYHEATPGHHFQITIESELDGPARLPAFRLPPRRRLRTARAGASTASASADEMGLYDNAWERLGMLDGQAWRAARLVVDTGIHAFKWTRAAVD